jgi:polar amino acid transport system substrate-binding protein
MRYPMAGGEANAAESLGNIVFVAMRPIGGAADWDGIHFSHVTRPVLFNAAARSIYDKLADLNLPRDSDTPQEAQMMTRLLAGRADIAIGREDAVTALLETQPFRGHIEILPRPFVSTPTYLAFRDSVVAANPGFADAVWTEIGRMRRAPDWEERARRLLAPASATSE